MKVFRLFLPIAGAALLAACTETAERKAPPPAPAPVAPPAPPVATPPIPEREFLAGPRAEEAQRLRAAGGRARRAGDRLVLQLAGGREQVLTDVLEPEADTKAYFFVRHYPGPGYYLVHYLLYEGDGYVLVRAADGAVTEVAAEPVFAPDSSRLVVASFDLTAGYNPTVLEVYRLAPQGLRREFSEEPADWGPGNPVWLDSATVQFDRMAFNATTGEETSTGRHLLRRGADGSWRQEGK